MLLVLAFVAAWMLQHTWSGKVSDFQGNRDQVRQQIDRAHPNWDAERREKAVHRATRRSAAGWLAYQFRHGWSPMVGDVVDGYRAAQIGHAEWLRQRPDEPDDGWWQRAKAAADAGWAGSKAEVAESAKKAFRPTPPPPPDPDPRGGPEPKAPEAVPATLPLPTPEKTADRHPLDGTLRLVHTHQRPPAPTERTQNMSDEVTGYAGARQLTTGYQNSLNSAADQLDQYEADLLAGGLGNDPGVINSLAAAKEALQNAQAAFKAHADALAGHEQGAEYAADKGAAAANTQWLGNGA